MCVCVCANINLEIQGGKANRLVSFSLFVLYTIHINVCNRLAINCHK